MPHGELKGLREGDALLAWAWGGLKAERGIRVLGVVGGTGKVLGWMYGAAVWERAGAVDRTSLGCACWSGGHIFRCTQN